MNRQPSEVWFFLCKSANLANHCPKCTVSMIFYEILINSIVIQIQSGTEHAAKNHIRLCVFQSADCRHDSHVQLRRFLRSFTLSCYLCPAILGIKEFSIVLDLFSHREIRHQAHLIHPHGNQIRTEFFTVQLHVNQPVIIRLIKGKRVVDKIVTDQVIVR